MLKRLISRLPGKQNTLKVFGTAAFIVYGWTIYESFWKVPSWIYFLKLSEIFSIYAYSFLVNFVESILLILGLIFVNFFLSSNLWKDSFSSASVAMLVILVGSAILHLRLYENPNLRASFIDSQLRWWSVTVFFAFVASYICVRISWLRRSLENLADRFVVFLYIYIPLTILSFGIVIVRAVL